MKPMRLLTRPERDLRVIAPAYLSHLMQCQFFYAILWAAASAHAGFFAYVLAKREAPIAAILALLAFFTLRRACYHAKRAMDLTR